MFLLLHQLPTWIPFPQLPTCQNPSEDLRSIGWKISCIPPGRWFVTGWTVGENGRRFKRIGAGEIMYGSLLLRGVFFQESAKKCRSNMFVGSWKKICKDSCKMIQISFTQSSFKMVSTWRIIPFSKWLITKVSFVPWLGLLLYLSKWPF